MRPVQLEEVEAGGCAALCQTRRTPRTRAPCPTASSRAAPGAQGGRGWATARPAPVARSRGMSSPSHDGLVDPLRPEWPSWSPISRCVGVHEAHDAFPCPLLGVVPQTCTARRDPPRVGDARHLGHHQPGAADRAAAEVHQVPLVGNAVNSAEYCAMADTTTRLRSRMPRRATGRRREGSRGRRGAPPAAWSAGTSRGCDRRKPRHAGAGCHR